MTTDAQRAAIRRATLTAHKDIGQLDARALEDLQALYLQAAADIVDKIAAHAGGNGSLTLQELQNTLAQVTQILRDLSARRDVLLGRSLQTAATVGVSPYAAAEAGAIAVLPAGAAMTVSDRALEFVRTFVAEDGLQLSDRIWRLDRHARDIVVNAIERSVIQGHGASQAALEFLASGRAVPADIAAKMRTADAAAIGKDVAKVLLRDPANPMRNAMRLFRTEINRAHGEAYMMGGEDLPGFAGWKYLLSPAHPKPDICDLLSTQNLYGLGPGVYPTRAKCPWPAHPDTLSFIVIVFEDEITDADRAGKQTSMEALQALTEEQRRGVLGVEKADVNRQGKLTQGMIRTPLHIVRRRISALEAREEKRSSRG